MASPIGHSTLNHVSDLSMISSNSARAIFSVSELNKRVKKLLDTEIPTLQVRGEISNFSKPTSGHWYFNLKDDRAQIRCAMFAGSNKSCKLIPSQGLEVVVSGKVSIYEERGDYQMIIDKLEASGIGALHKAFELLKQQLLKQGLFDQSSKLALPKYPKRVALITSATGAAVADMIHIFNRRAPNVELVIFPAIVQGEQAVGSLMAMLDYVERATAPMIPFNLVIIGRGGGSLEDLWAFNDESLARRLASYSIPCISAVGHEIDHSIADYAASSTAVTPSAAAEIATQQWYQLRSRITQQQQLLYQRQRQQIQLKRQSLQRLSGMLNNPMHRLRQQSQRLDYLTLRMADAMQHQRQSLAQRLQHSLSILEAMNPSKVLERGYSILLDSNDKPITTVTQLKKGQAVRSQLKDGIANLEVTASHHRQ